MNRNDQQFIAQKIRTQYMEQQPSEPEALHTLDAEIKRPANVFAYGFGSVSTINMGACMILTVTEIGTVLGLANSMIHGIAVGVVGMV